jgi:signal transduction histidine kinase
LQVWLVAILIAVGALASLAVLLSILPTFESSLREARAVATAHELYTDLDDEAVNAQPADLDSSADLSRWATQIGEDISAQQVRIQESGQPSISGASVGCCGLLNSLQREYGAKLLAVDQMVTDGNRAVFARVFLQSNALGPFPGSQPGLTIEAATPIRGISSDELATIQTRLGFAVAAVLLLAALAGYGLSVLVGRRIAVLATTASSLASGDLGARAPHQGIREFAVLGDSLNSMAGRIERQVGEITGERDRARVLISSLVEGVVAVSDSGHVMLINPAARRLLGLERASRIREVADLPGPIGAAIHSASGVGTDAAQESEISLDDGTELQLAIARVADPGAGVVVTVRDITEQRRLERARRDLVANVSHELKTPLAAIKGLLELLQGGRVDVAHREEFLNLMGIESDRLERLVEEQLQLARLDSGALPLEREQFDLDALVEGVVASRLPLAEAQGVRLLARNDAFVAVDADPARIEQILLILLDNALRHTPVGGEIVVGAHRTTTEARLEVADTGEGIPVEEQPFVFDRFYRGDQSREGRSAGLGLAIARGLAKAHGGVIDLVSASGVGSVFTLRLPVAGGPVTIEEPAAE